MMIGDSLTADIQGAINCGIDSIWFNHQQLQQQHNSTYTIHALPELLSIL